MVDMDAEEQRATLREVRLALLRSGVSPLYTSWMQHVRPCRRHQSYVQVSILSCLKHPNIIGHIESFEQAGHLHIVCDFAGTCVSAHRYHHAG